MNESSGDAVDESTGRVDPLAGLAVGRIVHYVLGQSRPAIVLSVRDGGFCDLHVFLNPNLDPGESNWKPCVPYSENTTSYNTWHWPPRV